MSAADLSYSLIAQVWSTWGFSSCKAKAHVWQQDMHDYWYYVWHISLRGRKFHSLLGAKSSKLKGAHMTTYCWLTIPSKSKESTSASAHSPVNQQKAHKWHA